MRLKNDSPKNADADVHVSDYYDGDGHPWSYGREVYDDAADGGGGEDCNDRKKELGRYIDI